MPSNVPSTDYLLRNHEGIIIGDDRYKTIKGFKLYYPICAGRFAKQKSFHLNCNMTSEAVSYDSSRAGTTTSGQLRGSGLMNKSLKDMNKSLKNVTRKQEVKEEHDEKPGCSLPNNTTCPLCIELHKVTKTKQKLEDWEEEIPATVLSIIGDSKKYLPCETIKNQLKRGLLELMKKTNIWIITEGRNTCVGEIVEEVIRGNTKKTKSHVLHRDITSTSKEQCRHQSGETFIQPDECSLEVCIKDHLKIPLILIVVGGDENSFKTAMTYLKMNFPVLVIDGSGSAADFICKGYRMHKNSAEKTVFLNTFQSEMTEAATTIFCSFEEKQNTNKTSCERLTMQLQEALEENWKSIYVYLVNDTTYTLDSTIQDILFKFLCKDEKNKEKLTDNILYFVDLWNRPDIAGKEIFKLGNSKVLENLKDKLGIKHSYLSKLFTNALVFNRVSLVKQVLEYLLDKEQYKQFLDHSLEDLYENTDCMAGYFISTFKKTGIIARFIPLTCLTRKKQETYKQKNIVKKINDAVIKILGSQQMKPFDEGDNKNNDAINGIRIDDIFKHLFIWAVLMNRRDLAMLFWKKENSDYICSALYASSLAKRLADMLAGDASAEEFMDELAGLLESSRYYEDLAYSVMTELYSNDRKHARQLLVTEVTRYNSTTIFTIAEKFTLMKFMGHAACQTKLTQIWKGRILGDISILYAIIVTFLPFLIMWTVRLDNTDEITVHRVIPSLMTDTRDQETQKSVKLLNWMRKIYYFYNSPLIKFFVSVTVTCIT
ncbi:TRPM3 [Mytilus coruscus]|uniref:TRPM3 n=1 Tax=Mytilus coruscus TaxID=42192 RepID=A0A6J8CWB2_MYTCO|nr:TRPM3 [Mytilus coruscus]